MIKNIELWNYRLFDHIKFDMSDNSKSGAKNLAVIYGENGSGKTTVIESIFTIKNLMDTIIDLKGLAGFQKKINELQDNTDNNGGIPNEIVNKIMKENFKSTKQIYDEIRPINMYNCNVRIKLEFVVENKRGYYDIVLCDGKIIAEELRFVLNKRITDIIKINNKEMKINKNVVKSDFKNVLDDKFEKYWGTHSILAIINNELNELSKDYIDSNIDKDLVNLIKWFRRISISTSKSPRSERADLSIKYNVLKQITEGETKNVDKIELNGIEKALSIMFSDLYLDIESVTYKYNDDRYLLHFDKLINGEIVSIPYYMESTGTNKILELFPFIVSLMDGGTVLIDEFDNGIHDLIMLDIMRDISENIGGQLVVSTHSTLMLDELNKNNVYILDSNIEGFKEIVPISDYDGRIQKNNSIRSMYIKGALGGIPNTENVNFKELINSMGEYIDGQKKKKTSM